MSAPKPLRMTEALRDLITKTAAHVNMTPSDVIRATCVGIRHGRSVIPREIAAEYYESGDQIMTFKGLDFPEIERNEFRRAIALRCFEALDKPAARKYTPPAGMVQGVDYIIAKTEEE